MKTFKKFLVNVIKNTAMGLLPVAAFLITYFSVDREVIPFWLLFAGATGLIAYLEVVLYIGRQDMPESFLWALAISIPVMPFLFCIGNSLVTALGYKHAELASFGIGVWLLAAAIWFIYGVIKLIRLCHKKGWKKVWAVFLGYGLALIAGYFAFMWLN